MQELHEEADDREKAETEGSEQQKSDYNFSILGQPDFAMANIEVPVGGSIKAEASAMVAMDTSLSMTTGMSGGFKRFITGNDIIVNHFTADQIPGKLQLSSGMPGDIKQVYVSEDSPLYLASSNFLAASPDISLETEYSGFVRGALSGTGFFLAKCIGNGDVLFNSYGAIVAIEVEDEFVVDNNHIVAFSSGLDYSIEKFGDWKSFFLSGEGVVTRFSGQGTVWMQTRKIPAFMAWINPFRRTKKKSD